jgi:hypothetical protein
MVLDKIYQKFWIFEHYKLTQIELKAEFAI